MRVKTRFYRVEMIAEAARYYMVHIFKPRYSELSISQQEREVILTDETINKTCCVCQRGLELEITHRKFLLFDGNTIPHNQHSTFPPMERDNMKWWLRKQLTTMDLSRLSLAARRWMMGKEYKIVKETLFAPAQLYFMLKTVDESYEFENVQNSNVLEVLCMNMDEVWSLLERLFEKVFDKALTYDKTNFTDQENVLRK